MRSQTARVRAIAQGASAHSPQEIQYEREVFFYGTTFIKETQNRKFRKLWFNYLEQFMHWQLGSVPQYARRWSFVSENWARLLYDCARSSHITLISGRNLWCAFASDRSTIHDEVPRLCVLRFHHPAPLDLCGTLDTYFSWLLILAGTAIQCLGLFEGIWRPQTSQIWECVRMRISASYMIQTCIP